MFAIRRPRPWHRDDRATTPETHFWTRRDLVRALAWSGTALATCGRLRATASPAPELPEGARTAPALGRRFADLFPAPRHPAHGLAGRTLTPESIASAYNNFYEFTTEKERVWQLAYATRVEPWTVEVRGAVAERKTLDLEKLFRTFPLEERVYRFRCVERWSMQVPWTGFPLARLVEACAPLGAARYVRFVSLLDKRRFPGQARQTWYDWPYHEALRLDEARHELAFVVLGAYGHALPMQHGAPLRIAMPWKYGYKSPKSIVAIEFTETQPPTFWNEAEPNEYGFYSNVDPARPHPRWSQALERDIGTGEDRPTLPFNGYGAEVATLYRGDEF